MPTPNLASRRFRRILLRSAACCCLLVGAAVLCSSRPASADSRSASAVTVVYEIRGDEPIVAPRPDDVDTDISQTGRFSKFWRKRRPKKLEEPEAGQPVSTSQKTAPAKKARKSDDPLHDLVDKAIDLTTRRILSADVHTPWQIAHGVLALRQNYFVKKDGRMVRALDWIATGPLFKGKPWWLKTEHGGKGHPFTEPYAFEGHPNQFMALFSMARLPRSFEFRAGPKGEHRITVGDIIENAKAEVNDEEEVAWTLWTLIYYIPPDSQWTNANGESWSIERMVQIQMGKDLTRSACGGTHGLFAVASARNAWLQAGKPLRGTWLESHMYIERYIATARSMQNGDGSFSSEYFKGPGWTEKIDRRISTSGHTLEFLMVSLPQKKIKEQWIRNAVARVAEDLVTASKTPLEPGGMYHALDSLILYRQRTRSEYASFGTARSVKSKQPAKKDRGVFVPPAPAPKRTASSRERTIR